MVDLQSRIDSTDRVLNKLIALKVHFIGRNYVDFAPKFLEFLFGEIRVGSQNRFIDVLILFVFHRREAVGRVNVMDKGNDFLFESGKFAR